MKNKILAMCLVALLAVGGIGMLAAKPLASVTGTAVLARGNVPVDDIGVDSVGYKIYTGTGMGAELVGVKLSFTAAIPSGSVIFVSVRNSGGSELGYDAQITAAQIEAGSDTMFDLWTSAYYPGSTADVDWDTWAGGGTAYWPLIPDVNYLIVTVGGNSIYVTAPGA
jgi:hypothetical protein